MPSKEKFTGCFRIFFEIKKKPLAIQNDQRFFLSLKLSSDLDGKLDFHIVIDHFVAEVLKK